MILSLEGVCLVLRASSGKRARLSGFVLRAVTPFPRIRGSAASGCVFLAAVLASGKSLFNLLKIGPQIGLPSLESMTKTVQNRIYRLLLGRNIVRKSAQVVRSGDPATGLAGILDHSCPAIICFFVWPHLIILFFSAPRRYAHWLGRVN